MFKAVAYQTKSCIQQDNQTGWAAVAPWSVFVGETAFFQTVAQAVAEAARLFPDLHGSVISQDPIPNQKGAEMGGQGFHYAAGSF